ncbi:hypothetical protein DXG01_015334 [Tephrocybe rancida]|nr:hypothetical protein DXG01_015334 [Tephrocybe rancida]
MRTASEEEAIAIEYCVVVLGKNLVVLCNQVTLPRAYQSAYVALMERLDPQSSSAIPSTGAGAPTQVGTCRCRRNANGKQKKAAGHLWGGAGSSESGEDPIGEDRDMGGEEDNARSKDNKDMDKNDEGLNEETTSTAQWVATDLPAPPSSLSQNLIVKLSNITRSNNVAAIRALVKTLSEPASQAHYSALLHLSTSLSMCIQQCRDYDAEAHQNMFYCMLNLIQLALTLDKESVAQGRAGMDIIAMEHGVSVDSLKGWCHKGQRFCCLAAGGTLYILILLATLEMYRDVVVKVVSNPILTVGRILRCPPDDPTGNLVREVIIPMVAQMAQNTKLSNLSVLAGDLDKILKFSDVAEVDAALDGMATHAFHLPIQDHISWQDVLVPIILPPVLPPSSEDWIANTTHVSCSFSLAQRKCSLSRSLTTEEHKAWTETEREKGEAAPIAENMCDLKDFMASSQHLSSTDDSYIQWDPSMLNRGSLKLSDKDGQLVTLVLTNMKEALGPSMLAFEDKLRSLYFAENMDNNSCREAFTFIAQHYNGYSTLKGPSSPELDITLYQTYKERQQDCINALHSAKNLLLEAWRQYKQAEENFHNTEYQFTNIMLILAGEGIEIPLSAPTRPKLPHIVVNTSAKAKAPRKGTGVKASRGQARTVNALKENTLDSRPTCPVRSTRGIGGCVEQLEAIYDKVSHQPKKRGCANSALDNAPVNDMAPPGKCSKPMVKPVAPKSVKQAAVGAIASKPVSKRVAGAGKKTIKALDTAKLEHNQKPALDPSPASILQSSQAPKPIKQTAQPGSNFGFQPKIMTASTVEGVVLFQFTFSTLMNMPGISEISLRQLMTPPSTFPPRQACPHSVTEGENPINHKDMDEDQNMDQDQDMNEDHHQDHLGADTYHQDQDNDNNNNDKDNDKDNDSDNDNNNNNNNDNNNDQNTNQDQDTDLDQDDDQGDEDEYQNTDEYQDEEDEDEDDGQEVENKQDHHSAYPELHATYEDFQEDQVKEDIYHQDNQNGQEDQEIEEADDEMLSPASYDVLEDHCACNKGVKPPSLLCLQAALELDDSEEEDIEEDQDQEEDQDDSQEEDLLPQRAQHHSAGRPKPELQTLKFYPSHWQDALVLAKSEMALYTCLVNGFPTREDNLDVAQTFLATALAKLAAEGKKLEKGYIPNRHMYILILNEAFTWIGTLLTPGRDMVQHQYANALNVEETPGNQLEMYNIIGSQVKNLLAGNTFLFHPDLDNQIS